MTRSPVRPPAVAVIDEEACIGCTLCIEACPVDAIAGAAALMHTVIAAECTGCRWCVTACPVDCISMSETEPALTHEARKQRAARYRRRYRARRARLEREPAEGVSTAGAGKGGDKQATIDRVMQRARQRLQERGRS
jgi:electron transport complex protein RnfB